MNNIEFGPGTIVFQDIATGEKFEVGSVETLETEFAEDAFKENPPIKSFLTGTVFTCEAKINPALLRRFLVPWRFPNNYVRARGGIVYRRKQVRKWWRMIKCDR